MGKKYNTLIRILDSIREEAPSNLTYLYQPDESEKEKLQRKNSE